MTDIDHSQNLQKLLPTRQERIIDVVAQAGHDVEKWSLKDDGTTAKCKPSVNPRFCYRWSFTEEDRPSLLCIWFRQLEEANGVVFHQHNMREEAMRLEKVAENWRTPEDVANRARKHAKEARRMNDVVRDAFAASKPLHLAIVHSKKVPQGEDEPSSAQFRQLDDSLWTVTSYVMETGDYKIVRGIHATQPVEQNDFADQFSEGEKSATTLINGVAYIRSKAVRDAVLVRAAGKCEYCGETGFETKSGKIYLETHHITPLSDGGADREYNVIGLCPNDHMAAHHSTDKEDLKAQLKKIVERFKS
jgi:hypothetical protein